MSHPVPSAVLLLRYTVLNTAKPVYNETVTDRNSFPLGAGSVSCRYLKFESLCLQALGSVKSFRETQVSITAEFPLRPVAR